MLKYATILYPSFRLTEEQMTKYAEIWAAEFRDDSCEIVSEAFRIARTKSPIWMPPVPSIQDAIKEIQSRKTPEEEFLEQHGGRTPEQVADQEFREAHCGKSRSEWASYKSWESSRDGSEKIKAYKQRLAELVGI